MLYPVTRFTMTLLDGNMIEWEGGEHGQHFMEALIESGDLQRSGRLVPSDVVDGAEALLTIAALEARIVELEQR